MYPLDQILDLEKYLPVMTAEEVAAYERMCIEGTPYNLTQDTLHHWGSLLNERQARITCAMQESII